MPEKIERDERNRLHCATQSAIRWDDGYELFYWHGRVVPKEWILDKASINRETIITETNAELRRCLQEILGSEKFASLLDIVEIDSDIDPCGNPQQLFRTKEKDTLLDEYLYFARVICPSTNRVYFLCVPEFSNIWDAVAWTFGKNKLTYKPIIQT